MKKLILTYVVLLTLVSQAYAQKEEILPFFDKTGNVALQTEEMKSLADTIAVVNHRRDDIVWSRIVYRVIDMREKKQTVSCIIQLLRTRVIRVCYV